MVKYEKVSPEGVLKQFSAKPMRKPSDSFLTSSQISDAMQNLTGYCGALNGLNPLKNEFKFQGQIITAETESNDWGTVLQALEIAKEGNVLFLKANDDKNAIWGELTSKSAINKGIAGTIVYGATRDVTAIKEMNYPVFSLSIVPNAGQPLGEGSINSKLRCKNIVISPNDYAFADECGVIIVPQEILDEVLEEALKIKSREEQIITLMEEGMSLKDILEL